MLPLGEKKLHIRRLFLCICQQERLYYMQIICSHISNKQMKYNVYQNVK